MKGVAIYSSICLCLLVFWGSSGIENKISEPRVEIKFYPEKEVYPYSIKGPGSSQKLQTLVLHNIAVINTASEEIEIEGVSIIALKDREKIQTQRIPIAQLKKEANTYHQYQELGYLELYDFQFQTSKLLNGTSLAAGLSLEPNKAIILTKKAFLFQTLPDSMLVQVSFQGIDGKKRMISSSLAVNEYRSPNTYSFPLKGKWFVGGAPNLHSHHRWGILQEYAYDFVQLGSGTKDHTGDGTKLNEYFAFGQSIHSIGDGVVVSAHEGEAESDENLRKLGESMASWTERSMLRQQELLSKGFEGVLGNYVVIRHPGNEYSYFIHLKKGSLAVEVGQHVKAGQIIGEVGHSGNSESPHLHFHLADGPDPVNSRSLPIRFSDIESWPDGSHVEDIQYGHIVYAHTK